MRNRGDAYGEIKRCFKIIYKKWCNSRSCTTFLFFAQTILAFEALVTFGIVGRGLEHIQGALLTPLGRPAMMTANVVKDIVKDVAKELTDIQKVILKLIKENPSLSASEMSQKTGMVTRTIQRDLASLHEKGILTREGGRKDGRWVIKK